MTRVKLGIIKLEIKEKSMPVYSDAIIREAKELWEGGMSYPDVADRLNISRWMTIGDWKRRFGWQREESDDVGKDLIEIWTEVAERALGHLQSGKFISITEAIKTFERANYHIRKIEKALGEKKDSKNSILGELKLDEESTGTELMGRVVEASK